LFTKHLLEALTGAADKDRFGDGDGKVSVAEVKRYLDQEMTYQARRRFARDQNATVQGSPDTVLAAVPPPARLDTRGLIPLDPAPEIEAIDREYAAAEAARVRAAPDVRASQLGSLKEGQSVHVLGKVKGEKWYLVEHAGKQGYVAADLLRPKGQQAAAPAVRPPPSPKAAEPAVGVYPGVPKPGTSFKDCPECPEMVVVPAGSFTMGSSGAETTREGVPDQFAVRERPQRPVTIARPFALGKFHVTRGEFAAFAGATGYVSTGCHVFKDGKWEWEPSRSWRDPGFAQTDRHPVVCVSHEDAKRYAGWLRERTGKDYRLASETEWEYAARGGTATARYWGDGRDGACDYANGADQSFAEALNLDKGKVLQCRDGFVHTSPAGSFRANGFGLHDMLGNAWQWVEDCWHENYAGAPSDGSARLSGDCRQRVLRGGSWGNVPGGLRSAARYGYTSVFRYDYNGFRVARTF